MTLLLLLKKVKGVEVTSQELGSGGWGLGLAVRFLFEQAKCYTQLGKECSPPVPGPKG